MTLDPHARERSARKLWPTLGLVLGLMQPAGALADGWTESIEVHGFFNSTSRFIVPNFDANNAIQMSHFKQNLHLEITADLYSDRDWNIGAMMILDPSYDLVYDLYPTLYGKRAQSGAVNTQITALGANVDPRGFRDGDSVPGAGDGINQVFRYVNQDVAFNFTGKNAPGIVIDNVVFYGQTVAPVTPRGSNYTKVGGYPTLFAFLQGPAAAASASLMGSVAAASQPTTAPLLSPGQSIAVGDRQSLTQAPFGINDTEGQLRTDCFDTAHPWCFLSELYVDIERGNTFMRLGKQQIVWGKTDAFRLQDIINPLDFGEASIFTPLENRRYPVWSLDLIQSLGDVGPFQDVSAEFVWVVDRFMPAQLGQCGEQRTYLVACSGRANAAAHGLVGIGLSGVEERDWQLRNTEPGFRLEGRLDDPAISFSLSAFWGFSDTPVPNVKNAYSFTNPNPGALLYLQALNVPLALAGAGLGALIPTFAAGFDPYSAAAINTAAGELRTVWLVLFGPGGALCNATTAASVQAHANCISASGLQSLGLPFSSTGTALEYPRVLTLGGSLDYQIPGSDAIVNFEMAFDVNRPIATSHELDQVDESNVIKAALSVDWSPFIPFINRSRTSVLNAQAFVEHIVSYEDAGQGRRMVPDQTQVITTLAMQNFWRNDSLILTNFLAADWNAQAYAWGPTLKWIVNERFFVEAGAHVVWSKPQKRALINLCPTGDLTIACLSDPATWVAGTGQALNRNFLRKTEAPIFAQSFGDHLEENRDTVFFSLTYQF